MQKNIKKKLSSSFLMILLALLLVYLGYQLFEVYQKNKLINDEMDSLEQEILVLDEKIIDLDSTIEYLESDLFVEEEGRTKLGLAKEGEQVVIITKEKDSLSKDLEEELAAGLAEKKNWLNWWKYFFK